MVRISTRASRRRRSAASRRCRRAPASGRPSARRPGCSRAAPWTACAPVGRLAHDLDVGLGVEHHPQAGADERLVVDEQDADVTSRAEAGPHDEPAAVGACSRRARRRTARTRSRMPDEALPGLAERPACAGPVVGDLELDVVGAGSATVTRAGTEPGVLERVGQRLLDDPVRRAVDAVGDGACRPRRCSSTCSPARAHLARRACRDRRASAAARARPLVRPRAGCRASGGSPSSAVLPVSSIASSASRTRSGSWSRIRRAPCACTHHQRRRRARRRRAARARSAGAPRWPRRVPARAARSVRERATRPASHGDTATRPPENRKPRQIGVIGEQHGGPQPGDAEREPDPRLALVACTRRASRTRRRRRSAPRTAAARTRRRRRRAPPAARQSRRSISGTASGARRRHATGSVTASAADRADRVGLDVTAEEDLQAASADRQRGASSASSASAGDRVMRPEGSRGGRHPSSS